MKQFDFAGIYCKEESIMTIKLQIYKCNVCGNLVQVLLEGDGNLICCGKEMELMGIQYDTNELGEKHTPKIELKDGKKYVNVFGHPMTKEHYIQFIESYTKDKQEVHIKFFKPDEAPETEAKINTDDEFNTIEYCNIHNLWGNNKMLENEDGNYSI
jgi:superoxide reductase